MVRFTLALAGQPADEASRMEVSEQVVDILGGGEQLEETFLCDINPKGQVPVLGSPLWQKPLADSLQITNYICTRYPHLQPRAHHSKLSQLLEELHEISYFALSFGGKASVASGILEAIENRLTQTGISEHYRAALEYKLVITKNEKSAHVQPDYIKQNELKTREFLSSIEQILPSVPSKWVFDLPTPSALDAHLVVFIARLMDLGRNDLVPQKVGEYATNIISSEEWRNVMQGRKTMYGV